MIICGTQCDIVDMVREALPRKAAKAFYLLELQDLLGDKAVFITSILSLPDKHYQRKVVVPLISSAA